MRRYFVGILVVVVSIGSRSLWAAEVAKLALTSPLPYEVVQREGFESGSSHDHHPSGPTTGYADVHVRGTKPEGVIGRWEFRRFPQ